ncbi:MAG: hypothetical protein ABSA54_00085 [Terriglobales bacterium]|jgi:hypothetical protein
MSKEDQQNKPAVAVQGGLSKFLSGGEFGAIEDPQEYERRISALPPAQREFAEEGTRFANLWQYFSEHRMELPRHIVEQIGELSRLPAAEQIATMRRVNQALMEYLNDVGEDSGVRQ